MRVCADAAGELIFRMLTMGRKGSVGFGTPGEKLALGRLIHGNGRGGKEYGQSDPRERALRILNVL